MYCSYIHIPTNTGGVLVTETGTFSRRLSINNTEIRTVCHLMVLLGVAGEGGRRGRDKINH